MAQQEQQRHLAKYGDHPSFDILFTSGLQRVDSVLFSNEPFHRKLKALELFVRGLPMQARRGFMRCIRCQKYEVRKQRHHNCNCQQPRFMSEFDIAREDAKIAEVKLRNKTNTTHFSNGANRVMDYTMHKENVEGEILMRLKSQVMDVMEENGLGYWTKSSLFKMDLE